MELLNQYEQDGYLVKEYTKDGTTVSNTVKVFIQTEIIAPIESQPTIEEQLAIKDLQIKTLEIQQKQLNDDLAIFMDFVLSGGM